MGAGARLPYPPVPTGGAEGPCRAMRKGHDMRFETFGGIAALLCAATYVAGFALMLGLLAPSGYGQPGAAAADIVAFLVEHRTLMLMWNGTIYILNALLLSALAVALGRTLAPGAPGLAAWAQAVGLIWATLVLGAGMVANVGVAQAAALWPTDPEGAATLWRTLHAVELGLGGGNEIAGGVWALLVSLAGRITGRFGLALAAFGTVIGAAGLATVLPVAGETAGVIFGLGYIGWFAWVGVVLLRRPAIRPARPVVRPEAA